MPDNRALNDIMEFDHVIEVHEDGSITDRSDLYAPECFYGDDGKIDLGGSPEWAPLDGYSGQDRYNGPIMHPSEYIGGRLEDNIRATAGIYVAVIVTDLDDEDRPAGWVVLRFS